MCCRWPKAIHNLRLSLLQSYNWSKIKPDFVPKINTLLGYLFFFFLQKQNILLQIKFRHHFSKTGVESNSFMKNLKAPLGCLVFHK